ncbi:hypothetical protein D3C81_732160 [compost metagenome]
MAAHRRLPSPRTLAAEAGPLDGALAHTARPDDAGLQSLAAQSARQPYRSVLDVEPDGADVGCPATGRRVALWHAWGDPGAYPQLLAGRCFAAQRSLLYGRQTPTRYSQLAAAL